MYHGILLAFFFYPCMAKEIFKQLTTNFILLIIVWLDFCKKTYVMHYKMENGCFVWWKKSLNWMHQKAGISMIKICIKRIVFFHNGKWLLALSWSEQHSVSMGKLIYIPSEQSKCKNIEDNTIFYMANTVKSWFSKKKITIFDWPSRSLNINIIKNLWYYKNHQQFSTVAELKKAITEE